MLGFSVLVAKGCESLQRRLLVLRRKMAITGTHGDGLAAIRPEQVVPALSKHAGGPGCTLPIGSGSSGEIPAQAKLRSCCVQFGLSEEELILWVGLWVESDDDLRFFDRVVLAVVKRISEILQ